MSTGIGAAKSSDICSVGLKTSVWRCRCCLPLRVAGFCVLDIAVLSFCCFGSDALFYRDIYGQLMASNEQEVKQGRVSQIAQICLHLLSEAVGREELRKETDPEALGSFLANQLVAFLGMWGAGFFDHQACIAQVRGTWAASLLPYASSKSRPMLEMMCGSVMKGGVLDA